MSSGVNTNFVCVSWLSLFLFILTWEVGTSAKNNLEQPSPQWTYQCLKGTCERLLHTDGPITSLETCSMSCGNVPLWPRPHSLTQDNTQVIKINLKEISASGPDPRLKDAVDIFLENLNHLKPTISEPPSSNYTHNLKLHFTGVECCSKLTLETDEGYKLTVRRDNASNDDIVADITASNFYGARHALETLAQLIWWEQEQAVWKTLAGLDIVDKPKFPYRGYMLDTARNYVPLEVIKKVVDGMAVSKLNVLHLHLTDVQSFPVRLSRAPELCTYGAYGPEKIYSSEDIVALRQYADLRGIRLVLEVDAPGHVNSGWNYAAKDSNADLTMCNDRAGGQVNPDNPEALDLIEKIYNDLLELSEQNEIFHIGGDEVNLNCWRGLNSTRNFTNMKEFQVSYMNKMIDRLKKANNGTYPKHIVLWSSPITDDYDVLEKLAPKESITVQYWYGSRNFVYKKYHVIYSSVTPWYLDCGMGPWNYVQNEGVCEPFKHWRQIYHHRPWLNGGNIEQTLGGEVCLWTELVSEDQVEVLTFPRASSFAERVWADPEDFDFNEVTKRLMKHWRTLKARGVKVAGVWPEWCTQNPGDC